jgi:hypothetical protein
MNFRLYEVCPDNVNATVSSIGLEQLRKVMEYFSSITRFLLMIRTENLANET